jgi:hypothetical protein
MACLSGFATRFSKHPRPDIPDAIAPQPLPCAQDEARSSLVPLHLSASRDAAARVLGARFVVFR